MCENGYGKRTPFGANTPTPEARPRATRTAAAEPESARAGAEATASGEGDEPTRRAMRYRLQRRGGKGVKDVKVTAKNGQVVGVASVRDGDEIMLITKAGDGDPEQGGRRSASSAATRRACG